MRLGTGDPAPSFSVTDVYQRQVELEAYAGRRLMLGFYRSAVCPLCNIRFLQLMAQESVYHRSKLFLVAFFDSPPERVRQYFDRYDSTIPLVADPGRHIYDQYGLEMSWQGVIRGRLLRGRMYRLARRWHVGGNTAESLFQADGSLMRMPGEFLIAPDLRIHTAHYARDSGDFMGEHTIQKFLMEQK
ncbi:MAG: redoxin domain-containing protein [Ktedonobacterales bacterium]